MLENSMLRTRTNVISIGNVKSLDKISGVDGVSVIPCVVSIPIEGPMDTDLTAVKAALADISDTELVALILDDDDPAEQPQALRVAVADPAAALTSFRVLAADLRPDPAPYPDDRRTCEQCANLDRQRGRDGFRVAWRRVVTDPLSDFAHAQLRRLKELLWEPSGFAEPTSADAVAIPTTALLPSPISDVGNE
jgi:hypothetical protein